MGWTEIILIIWASLLTLLVISTVFKDRKSPRIIADVNGEPKNKITRPWVYSPQDDMTPQEAALMGKLLAFWGTEITDEQYIDLKKNAIGFGAPKCVRHFRPI